MFTGHSNNGGLPKLWCVEVVPKRRRLGEAEKKEALSLAKRIPSDHRLASLCMTAILSRLEDDRTAYFARMRQRLVVFTDKKEAARRASQETNESWQGRVRAVRVGEHGK